MNEVEFRNWLEKKGTKKKVQSDTISRLKRVEKEINRCDIDEQYRNDRCEYLLSLFTNMGNNEEMKKYTLRGKLFAIVGKNLNNRLAVFKWKN